MGQDNYSAVLTTSSHRAAPVHSQPVSAQKKKAELRRALGGKLKQFTKEFKKHDHDGSGSIEKQEFRAALRSMCLPHTDDETCDAIFREIDIDQSGGVSSVECLRYTILDILRTSCTRIYNLFKLWDADSSGTIDKEEWRDAIKMLGIDAGRDVADALFDELDDFKQGALEYEKLNKTLRKPPELFGSAPAPPPITHAPKRVAPRPHTEPEAAALAKAAHKMAAHRLAPVPLRARVRSKAGMNLLVVKAAAKTIKWARLQSPVPVSPHAKPFGSLRADLGIEDDEALACYLARGSERLQARLEEAERPLREAAMRRQEAAEEVLKRRPHQTQSCHGHGPWMRANLGRWG